MINSWCVHPIHVYSLPVRLASSLWHTDISPSAHGLDWSFHNAAHLDVYFLNTATRNNLLPMVLNFVLTMYSNTCQNLSSLCYMFHTMYFLYSPVNLSHSWDNARYTWDWIEQQALECLFLVVKYGFTKRGGYSCPHYKHSPAIVCFVLSFSISSETLLFNFLPFIFVPYTLCFPNSHPPRLMTPLFPFSGVKSFCRKLIISVFLFQSLLTLVLSAKRNWRCSCDPYQILWLINVSLVEKLPLTNDP